jgi:hypothetical protein
MSRIGKVVRVEVVEAIPEPYARSLLRPRRALMGYRFGRFVARAAAFA